MGGAQRTSRATDPQTAPRAETSSNPKAKVKSKDYNKAKKEGTKSKFRLQKVGPLLLSESSADTDTGLREIHDSYARDIEFDDILAKISVPESSSKLRSTNEAPEGDSTFIPVDPLCVERVLSKQRR